MPFNSLVLPLHEIISHLRQPGGKRESVCYPRQVCEERKKTRQSKRCRINIQTFTYSLNFHSHLSNTHCRAALTTNLMVSKATLRPSITQNQSTTPLSICFRNQHPYRHCSSIFSTCQNHPTHSVLLYLQTLFSFKLFTHIIIPLFIRSFIEQSYIASTFTFLLSALLMSQVSLHATPLVHPTSLHLNPIPYNLALNLVSRPHTPHSSSVPRPFHILHLVPLVT